MSDRSLQVRDPTAEIEANELRRAVAAREWYHTISLGPEIVTPGWFDTRGVAPKLPWPPLEGKRCLDIGTFDGFWAFEMERRGAREVIAIDILDDKRWDWPASAHPDDRSGIERRKGRGDGFLIAARALGSAVERVDSSIYDLGPGEHGSFDFVYLGSLLLHLRDPVLALQRVRSVCPGVLLAVDAVDIALSALQPRRPATYLDGQGRPYWHKPNLRGLRAMVRAAGFKVLRGPKPVLIPPGEGFHHPRRRLSSLRTRRGREAMIASLMGEPHAWILAQPEV
jgi:tRNA (mo5U34)-methyltransferase